MRTKQLYFSGFVAVLMLLAVACGTAGANVDARREQMRQEALAAFGDIELALVQILEHVNQNQRPDERLIQDAADLLEANRRNAPLFDSPERATFMLLQSWTAYYQDDPVNTINSAVRACREDMDNGDAWITQTLFSLIHGRRPLEPSALRQPPPAEQRTQQYPLRGRQADRADIPQNYDTSAPFGSPGILAFDLSRVRLELLRGRFPVSDVLDTEHKQVADMLGGDIFCVLIALDTNRAEPNEPGHTRPEPFGVPTHRLSDQRHSGSDLDAQRSYFQGLRNALDEQENVVFIEIDPVFAAMMDQLIGSHGAALPAGIAENAGVAAAALSQMQGLEPFMIIADSDGQVKYAGIAGGFMPAFILTHLTDVQIAMEDLKPDTETRYDTERTGHSDRYFDDYDMDVGLRDPNAARRPFDPNQITDPNQPAATSRSSLNTSVSAVQEFVQLPEYRRIEAERRISAIRDFFMRTPQTGGMTYKTGVDMCREVIRDYPETEYAHQARQLLRQVPERRRSLYDITDEELGL